MFKELPSTLSEMKAAVLSECIVALKLITMTDNFDKRRFNFDGVDRSNLFNTSERVFWFSWFFDNIGNLHDAYSLLNSDVAKRRFLSIIAYRLAGHHSVRVDASFNDAGEQYEKYLELENNNKPSLLKINGLFGSLKHFDFEYNGKRYISDCYSLKSYLFRKQYFFEEYDVQIQPNIKDFVIDAGACLGDTAVVFGKAIGPEGKVYSFDPVEDHLEVLRFNVKQNPDCKIFTFPCGLSDQDVECEPLRIGHYAPGFNPHNTPVPLRALDSLVIEGKIAKVDFIKMDIEGGEMSALKGSVGTIRKFRPKLAISIYHKPNDLYEIPIFINDNFQFYKMYIGHYSIHNEETVLYCMPME